MIRDQTIIGQTLEDCIIRLKKQRNASTGLRRTGVRKASATQATVAA
jgi:hypothetical protein